MPYATSASQLIELIGQVKHERHKELLRALGFRKSDPIKAAYHTGLADGRNGIVTALETLLNSTSIRKGDKESGR